MSDPAPGTFADDAQLLEALRGGDESAFEALVDKYHTSLVRLASIYAPDQRIAEEVAQETWLAVLRGLDRFEGRSSFKTWLFSILVNRAKTYAQREGRYARSASLDEIGTDPGESAVSPERFHPPDHPVWPGHWATPPSPWDDAPESRLESMETRQEIEVAITDLPDTQREVITLRDIQGLSSQEVCNILEITDTNQRVLLHRARSRVRRVLEQQLEE